LSLDLVNKKVNHLAVIMDGNGRWAKAGGMLRKEGHKKGVDALKRTIEACPPNGIKELSVYVFSSENWSRPQDEVSFLMGLFNQIIKKEVKALHKKNVCVRFIGDVLGLSASLQGKIKEAELLTKDNTLMTLNLCVNYGGRQEIVDATKLIAQKVVAGELNPDEIDDSCLKSHMVGALMSEPDLLIRTGGDYRISNYLLWHVAYTELWVTDVFWPDFDKNVLQQAIDDFSNRERRFGGL
jgi:undecaprenyl diphosphate synthase